MLSGEVDLQQFCGSESVRLASPWSVGEWSYATDGFIAVRVPRREDVPENLRPFSDGGPPDITKATWDHADLYDWQPLPPYDLSTVTACTLCKGAGRQTVCPECDGEGEVTIQSHYSEYEVECKTCKGDGVMPGTEEDDPPCRRCFGSGKNLFTPIPWGTGFIGMQMLERIKDLPAVRLNPFGDGLKPWRFVFIGGCGLVMPMLGKDR